MQLFQLDEESVKSGELACENNPAIAMYLNFEETDIVMEIVNEFHEIILEKLKEKNFVCEVSLSELLKSNDKRFKEWSGIYETAVMLYREERDGDSGDELLEEIIENTEFNSLCSAWFYVFVGGLPELEKEFEGYKEKIFFQYEDDIIIEMVPIRSAFEEFNRGLSGYYKKMWMGMRNMGEKI